MQKSRTGIILEWSRVSYWSLALILGGLLVLSGDRTGARVAIEPATDTTAAYLAELGELRGAAHAARAEAGADTPGRYRYFERPDPYDPWSFPILRWQVRSREGPPPTRRPSLSAGWGVAARGEPRLAETGYDLLSRYRDFVAERKRSLALEVANWMQTEGRRYYISDTDGDQWPTLDEVLERAGDDCDGLDLLAYSLLRGMGFGENEVYRAIVVRTRDNQHHMVTLWFETPEEPRVIDPTGAMTTGAPRMSEVTGWIPIRLFSETEQFAVQPSRRRAR